MLVLFILPSYLSMSVCLSIEVKGQGMRSTSLFISSGLYYQEQKVAKCSNYCTLCDFSHGMCTSPFKVKVKNQGHGASQQNVS